jgi:hypothetical protein
MRPSVAAVLRYTLVPQRKAAGCPCIAIACICQRAWHVAGSPDMVTSCVPMRRGYHVCKNSNDEIDHRQSQSSRIGAVVDNQWHEQRLTLTLIIPTQVKCHEHRVFRRRSTPTWKSTGQIQIQIRLPGAHVRGLCFVIHRTNLLLPLWPCLAGEHHLLTVHDRLPTLPTDLCTCILQLRRPFVTYRSAK